MKKDLRFVITRRCNYNCIFCHGEGVESTNEEVFNASDYAFIFEVCNKKFGWQTVTLTGGEPLLRNDFNDIVKCLNKKDAKITLVSNGEFINKYSKTIDMIDRINVSIHTLTEEKYFKIVRKKDKLKKVIRNLMELRNINNDIKIRINTTVKSQFNDSYEELKKLIDFSSNLNASMKFVELYSKNKNEIVPLYDIQQKIKKLNFRYKDNDCDKTIMFDGKIEIIFTKIFCTIAEEFYEPDNYCYSRNDLFITPDGYIKMCRKNDSKISIINEIKNRDINGLETKINMANSILGLQCPFNRNTKELSTLAIYGGTSLIFEDEGVFNHPYITKNIEESVLKQLNDTISIYDNSNIFKKFEYEFSKYHNRKYGLVVNSGTTALWSMYDGIKLKNGDEVICPIYTFFATVSPLLFLGSIPKFVDCDEYGNMDYMKIESLITNKTKAIIITHMWGYPCKMEKIKEISNKYNLFLLEDCSHAHGGSYRKKKLGEWGDAAVFSLQGKKIITGGEGGILITNNKAIYKNALLLGHYNKRCMNEISKDDIVYKYSITGKGMKLRAHPIAIKIAYESFKDIEIINKIKSYYANYMINEINSIEGLTSIVDENSKNSWYALIIKYDSKKFNDIPIGVFVEALQKEGAVEFDIPFSTCPLDKLELFKNPNLMFQNYKKSFIIDTYDNANNFYKNIIKVPIWYRQEDFRIVIKYVEVLKKVANYYKKHLVRGA